MLQPGDLIDIWVVEKPLGQGGMGSVYRCHNRSAQRILAAVKVLDPSLNRVESAKARFVREAEILFSLDHPNIVKVRNVRMDADLPYLEMEFVQGDNLEDRIYEGRLELSDALSLFRQAADALVYMHELGIRHRDIKPSNMIVEGSGALKLVDFGIATEQDGVTITESGQNFGSVSYAPPEWVDPDDLDPVKWDVYSLGVVFYELITGRFGFPISGVGTSRQKALQVMIAKQNHPPLDPGVQFPVALRALIRYMTRSRPEDRMATAKEVLDTLSVLDTEHIDADHVFGDEPEHRPTSATWYPGMEDSSDTMIPDVEDLEAVRQEIIERGGSEEPQPPPRGILPSSPPEKPPDDAPGDAKPTLASKTPTEPIVDETKTPSMLPKLAAGVVLLGLVGGAVWMFTQPPPAPELTSRAVDVVVAGVAADTPVTVTLGGQTGTAEGLVWHFGELDYGDHSVEARVGEGCDAPDATWCGVETTSFSLGEGEGVATATITVSAPTAIAITVSAPEVKRATGRIGELSFDVGKEPTEVASLMPGKHTLIVESGTCTEEHLGCWPECEKVCSSWSEDFVVAWGSEPLAFEAPIEPGQLALFGGGAKATVAEQLSGGGATTAAAAAVSYAQFSAWLGSHPDWQKDAAVAANKADGNYLKGWTDTTPPAGKDGHAVVNVSWAAASAYCSGRGGLAPLEAEPTTWDENSTRIAWHEYRQNSGKPAWRRSDGGVSTNVGRTDSRAFIGFRCAR